MLPYLSKLKKKTRKAALRKRISRLFDFSSHIFDAYFRIFLHFKAFCRSFHIRKYEIEIRIKIMT